MNTPSRPKSKTIAAYVDLLPPCNSACPAGENIQKWLSLAKEKKFQEAWEEIVKNNPLPAVHGRVCYHYCETKCNRIQYDETVGIHCVERFLGDMAIAKGWKTSAGESTGEKVLVVGAGPAGLSAAHHLRLMGHEITIYESLPQAGGTMLVGIPEYRLPQEILAGEINRILNMGIKIKYNHKVTDIIAEQEKGGFDAVFLSIGAHLGKNIALPVEDPCPIFDAVDYLREVTFNKAPRFGSRLVIYGGGNTAIDVARSAKRIGVSDISIVYHRTREKMSAFPHEIEEAMEEGIKFIFLRTIVGLNKNNLSLGINELDDKGRAQQSGKFENLETDALIFALNQTPDSEFLRKTPGIELQTNGVVTVDENFMTGCKGVFAGGDMIPYDRSVTIAVGQGKQAARHINAYLNDTDFNKPLRHEEAFFDKLHINEAKSPKTKQKILDPETRLNSFAEVVQGDNQDEILYETQRCFSCGNCFECDACYDICPVKAITKLGPKKRYEIDTENCIGCSKCFKSCPCGAIVMNVR
jgi:formate dehydrogenase (NADP+) beta subunit